MRIGVIYIPFNQQISINYFNNKELFDNIGDFVTNNKKKTLVTLKCLKTQKM